MPPYLLVTKDRVCKSPVRQGQPHFTYLRAQGMSAITLKDETGANAVELSVVDGLQQRIAVNNFKGKTAAKCRIHYTW